MTRSLTRPAALLSATAVTVVAALILPLLVHLVPSEGVPLGARLLLIFYAPFLAAAFFPPAVGLTAALLTPFVNFALTGAPPPAVAFSLSTELLVFVGFVLTLKRYRLPLVAPLAYLVARTVTFFVFTPAEVTARSAWASLAASFWLALPAVCELFLLNLAVAARQKRAVW